MQTLKTGSRVMRLCPLPAPFHRPEAHTGQVTSASQGTTRNHVLLLPLSPHTLSPLLAPVPLTGNTQVGTQVSPGRWRPTAQQTQVLVGSATAHTVQCTPSHQQVPCEHGRTRNGQTRRQAAPDATGGCSTAAMLPAQPGHGALGSLGSAPAMEPCTLLPFSVTRLSANAQSGTLNPRRGGREQLVTNLSSLRFSSSENPSTTRQKTLITGWSAE